MTAYEAGFAKGERDSFDDARDGRMRRIRPDEALTPYAHGFWDGYMPRTLEWAMRSKPAKSWIDRDQEEIA